jgi:MFS family permease
MIHHDTPNPKSTQGLNLLESLLQVEFWLISLIFFCVIGSGIVSVDHFSDLVLSRLPNMSIGNDTLSNGTFVNPAHYPEINYLVILFAVFNTLGRMAVGYFSDFFSNRMIRADWLIVSSALMCVVQIYFIFATPSMLYFGVIMLGIAYGGTFCILPTLVSEVFGIAHFGANFGFIGTAPALGSYLFNTLLGGKLLDHFEVYDRICVGSNKKHCQSHCYGDNCFRYVYITLAGVCGLSLVCSLLLRILLRDGFVARKCFKKDTPEMVS